MSFIKGGSAGKRKAALPPAVAVAAASGGSGNSSTGSSQGSSEYISEDEHIQHLDQSGALNQVAGSQSILSQELQQHHRHHQQHHDLPAGGDEETESNHDGGDLSQISNLDMGGFSQSSIIDCHFYGEESQASETVFNSQKAARKYGLLSQDPFALPARSLTEPPLSQRSTASAISISNHSLLPPPGSQGSSNNSSAESNFGSLLDAVQLFQSQEAEEERLQLSQETASSSHNREDREEGCDDDDDDNDGGTDRGYDPTVRTNKKKKSEQPSSPGEENIYGGRALTAAAAANKMSSSDNRSQKSNLAPGSTCTARRNNGNSSSPRKPTLPFAKKKVIGNHPMVAKNQPPPAVAPAPATPTTPIKNSAMSSNRNVGAPAVTNQTMTPAPPKVAPIANVTRVTDKTPTSDGSKKRKRKNDSEIVKQQKLAERAAALAQRTINDADLAKRLLLSMALTRENPRSAPEKLPGPGFSLPAGFFWAHYPPLEKGTFNISFMYLCFFCIYFLCHRKWSEGAFPLSVVCCILLCFVCV